MAPLAPSSRNQPSFDPKEPEVPLFVGAAWMFGIALALALFPLLNGLVGGFVGGYLMGRPVRALEAAIVPAILVGLLLFAGLALGPLVLVHSATGLQPRVTVVLTQLTLLLGALLGGWKAEHRPIRMGARQP